MCATRTFGAESIHYTSTHAASASAHRYELCFMLMEFGNHYSMLLSANISERREDHIRFFDLSTRIDEKAQQQ